ncbi:MAG: hypothetical protein LBJ61_02615 [Deltaproteobacteria bacterium]|jgi:hypothetical protein|nr:hypothetical protein [Deltaproteobacteria bacterium]
MRRLDIVRLTPEHLKELNEIVGNGQRRTRKAILAMALIWLDCGKHGPGLTDAHVSRSLGLSLSTLADLKRLYLAGGPRYAVDNAPPEDQTAANRAKIDLSFEDKLIDLANSEVPGGRERWSVRLLAKMATELKLIDSVSHMTIHRVLKKRNYNLAGGES